VKDTGSWMLSPMDLAPTKKAPQVDWDAFCM
jgi:hypothetical protein